MVNIQKLKGKIVEKYNTQSNFAKALGISSPSWTKRIRGIADFKCSEISKMIKLLDLTEEEVFLIFFSEKV